MAGITAAQAQAQLDIWVAANTAVAAGQEYSYSNGITSRTLKRSDAAEILQQIEFWDSQCKRLSSGSGTVVRQGVINAN